MPNVCQIQPWVKTLRYNMHRAYGPRVKTLRYNMHRAYGPRVETLRYNMDRAYGTTNSNPRRGGPFCSLGL